MKRGNDNSQLRADEVEELNDEESEERGTFQRASAEVLASRKIFKTKRPADSAPKIPAPVSVAAPGLLNTTAAVSANPFANFQGLASSNPFAGFQGLQASAKVIPPVVTPATAVIQPPAPIFSTMPSSHIVSSKPSDDSGVNSKPEGEYKSKMRKLNNAFHQWTNRQIVEHPLSIWKEGVQDYIKYAEELAGKYDKEEEVTTSSQSTFSVAKADIPTASSFKSTFGFGSAASKPLEEVSKVTAPAAITAPKATAVAPVTTTAAPSSTSSFSNTFAFAPLPVSTPAPVGPLSFGLPASTLPPAAAPFSFQLPATVAPGPSVVPSFGGFTGFGAPSTNFSGFGGGLGGFGAAAPMSSGGFGAGPAAGGDEDGGGDDDGEGEPILEPEKVLRNENDTDDILVEAPCKLFGYHKESKEWKDTGKGSFRVTRDRNTNKQRMLVRNPIGKLTFNAGFYKGMKIEKVKSSLRFSAFVVVDEPTIGGGDAAAAKKVVPELKGFMVKFKDTDVDSVLSKLEAGVAACE